MLTSFSVCLSVCMFFVAGAMLCLELFMLLDAEVLSISQSIKKF